MTACVNTDPDATPGRAGDSHRIEVSGYILVSNATREIPLMLSTVHLELIGPTCCMTHQGTSTGVEHLPKAYWNSTI